METKFCENCGEKLESGAVFCPKCGSKVGHSINNQSEHKSPVPDLGKPVQKKKKSKLKIFAGLVGAFLVVIILGSLGSGGNTSSKSSTTKKPMQEAVIQVKAEDLIDAYSKDEAAAEEKYKDKKVSVTGQLEMKHQFTNTQNFGLLIAHKQLNGRRYNVVVDIEKDNVDAANKVKQGDFIKADGVCVGKVEQKDSDEVSIQIKAKKLNE